MRKASGPLWGHRWVEHYSLYWQYSSYSVFNDTTPARRHIDTSLRVLWFMRTFRFRWQNDSYQRGRFPPHRGRPPSPLPPRLCSQRLIHLTDRVVTLNVRPPTGEMLYRARRGVGRLALEISCSTRTRRGKRCRAGRGLLEGMFGSVRKIGLCVDYVKQSISRPISSCSSLVCRLELRFSARSCLVP